MASESRRLKRSLSAPAAPRVQARRPSESLGVTQTAEIGHRKDGEGAVLLLSVQEISYEASVTSQEVFWEGRPSAARKRCHRATPLPALHDGTCARLSSIRGREGDTEAISINAQKRL